MGAGGQGGHYVYQPAAFEPGAAHRGLPAGRCGGGRHGTGAQNGYLGIARRQLRTPRAASSQQAPEVKMDGYITVVLTETAVAVRTH